MTSAADFHILSARNVFGLVAVVVAVLIPVGLKRVFKKDLGELSEAEAVLAEQSVEDVEVVVPGVHSVEDESVGGMKVGRRYCAVDSGLILAGPSPGDQSLHPERDTRVTGGKGKGRSMEIFAHIMEEDEEHVEGEEAGTAGNGGIIGMFREKWPPAVRGYGAVGQTDIGR